MIFWILVPISDVRRHFLPSVGVDQIGRTVLNVAEDFKQANLAFRFAFVLVYVVQNLFDLV